MSNFLDNNGLLYFWQSIKNKFLRGNAGGVFYGTCSTAAGTVAKVVECADFTADNLKAGTIIVVTFTITNSGAVADLTMNVNGTGAKHIKYINNGTLGNLSSAGYLKANTKYPFYYDGANWVCLFNVNTTYSALSEADMKAGTATTSRLITAARLKQAVEYHAPVTSVNGNTGNVTVTVPTKTSDLTNDSTFVTEAQLSELNGYQTINNINDMSNVTADKVLVLHNNSDYGDGGPCWFEYLDYATEGGYARQDGGKMYPMLDQGPLLTSDPPVEKMIGLMSSYLENDALVYGNEHTLFDSNTTNQIDCSSFVSAVLHGISYNSSKYTTGSSTRRVAKVASYSPLAGNIFGHLKSKYMAQYFAERRLLHSMPTTYQMRNVLQFGDILFSWDGTETTKNGYLEIGHVSIVLGIVNSTYIIVAQCGEYPSEVTIKNNSATVGKISTIALSGTNINKYFRAFARVPYINEHDVMFTGNRIKPILIPNIYVDGDRSGEISSSNVCATSYGYINVIPNSVLTFTGKTVHNGNNLTALVVEYDSKFKYLSKTNFTTSPKTLSTSTRYIRLCYSHTAGSDIPILLDDCDQFEATISCGETYTNADEVNY